MPALILTEAQWSAAAVAAKTADFVAWDNLRWTTHIGEDGKPDGQTQALYAADVDKDAFVEDVPADIVTAVTGFAADTKAPLYSYANRIQWATAIGGVEIDLGGGQIINMPTDVTTLTLLDGKIARLSKPNPPATIKWQIDATTVVTIPAAQLEAIGLLVDDHFQGTFDTLETVLAGIASGTITTEAQINAAFGGA